MSNGGRDFVDDDGDPYPDSLNEEIHGTHVAGIAAAEVNNGNGVTGIGNSSVIAGRALSERGSGSTADIADAITWAANEGADVINLSLGGGGYTNTMQNAVTYAANQGALVVAAAGNDGSGSVSYPAAYGGVLAVSALDPDESLASYSNYGPKIDLAAPGRTCCPRGRQTTTNRSPARRWPHPLSPASRGSRSHSGSFRTPNSAIT